MRFLYRSLCLLLLVVTTVACQNTHDTDSKEHFVSTYDQVIKTGTIRCGYLTYPPYCIKDPDSGKLSGLFVDVIERVAKKLGLKIVWAEEVGYGSLFTGLNSNRYDVFAGGLWPSAARAKVGDFSIPLFYSAVKAYGRTDENRFNNNLSALNSPKVTIAVIDGAMESIIAKDDFPKAKCLSLTQLSPFSQNLLNIVTKKADVTFAEPGIVSLFLKSNPGTLKELAPNNPLRIFGNTFVFNRGQEEFKNMLNTVLQEMLNSGEVNILIQKYKIGPESFYRVATPYQIQVNSQYNF